MSNANPHTYVVTVEGATERIDNVALVDANGTGLHLFNSTGDLLAHFRHYDSVVRVESPSGDVTVQVRNQDGAVVATIQGQMKPSAR